MIDFLIDNGRQWIIKQRELYRPQAAKLPMEIRQKLEPYFQIDNLNLVRVRWVRLIQNPDFYRQLEQSGLEIPLDFSETSGITFDDTILLAVAEKDSDNLSSLYFHECVHVVQYRMLGIDEFIKRYIIGWAENGFDYYSIPLEKQAFDLEKRFMEFPTESFSVEMEVKRSL